jgi:hypothetical protein
MPIKKPRLSKAEEQEYRRRVQGLQKRDVSTGGPDVLSRSPRLLLKQILPDFAKLYELTHCMSTSEVVLAVPVTMIVAKPDLVIAHVQLYVHEEGYPLDLDEPEEGTLSYEHIIKGYPYYPCNTINKYLRGKSPVRRQRVDGLLVGQGSIPFPLTWQDGSRVTATVLVTDVNGVELEFTFKVTVDRRLRYRFDRKNEERKEYLSLFKPAGLFGPNLGERDEAKYLAWSQKFYEKMARIKLHGREQPDEVGQNPPVASVESREKIQ